MFDAAALVERINSHFEVTVTDTGIGIPSHVLPHVFERFRQGESGPSRSYCGLGLGLAIVRHLVEQHGGTVTAEK
jgi:signal transduction histidine kinase